MRVVELNVVPSQDGAIERMTISVESKRNLEYVPKESWDVIAGTEEARRNIMIEDTDRIVLEAQANHTVAYDKEQMSATPAPIDKAAEIGKAAFDEQQARKYEEMEAEAEEKRKAMKGYVPTKTLLGNDAEDQSAAQREHEKQSHAAPKAASHKK